MAFATAASREGVVWRPRTTVVGALEHAHRHGHLSDYGLRRARGAYWRARQAAARLPGRRKHELRAVIEQVRHLARTRRLTASRIAHAVLLLERNTAFWRRAPLPHAGQRVALGRDGLVWQHYPGAGLQVQHLASFGKANALARVCRDTRKSTTCRPRKLRRLLDRLVSLAANRDGAPAWEHPFRFGGAAAGWVSGMTQGTAVQALARGAEVLRTRKYLLVARRALKVFELAPPRGVAVREGAGRHYVMYSTKPSLRILNGHLQATIGLRDLAMHGGGARARKAYRRGERSARSAVRRYDTGAWSLYSRGGREANLGYHRLQRVFLRRLCDRTKRPAYCAAERRFARYLTEPPRVRIVGTGVRARPLRFTLSKVSTVTMSVAGRRGLTWRRTVQLSRGSYVLPWRAGKKGTWRVAVTARGLSGPLATVTRTVVVGKRKR